MDAWLALLMMAAAPASAPASDSADGWRLVNPRAIELFEADGKLMDWALAGFDEDHDGYLSIMEADAAAREFKRIADADGDGQVTPAEYRAARAFIAARRTGSQQAQATRR
jgi:hypothetical protein